MAIAAIVLLFPAVAVNGILAAIAIPNFIKYQERAKAVEAKANLKLIDTLAKATLAETGQAPPTLPRTPVRPPCGKGEPWSETADDGWSG